MRFNPETRERSLDVLRWGLVPIWAKDLSIGAKCTTTSGTTSMADPIEPGMA